MELKESEFRKPINSEEDIIKQASKDLGLDLNLVKYVIKDFWNNFSHIIRNPLEYKLGISIHGFIKFTLNSLAIDKIERYYTKVPELAKEIEKKRKSYEK